MSIEEPTEGGDVHARPHLAQHPPDRLVDEVVFVVEEPLGESKCRLRFSAADARGVGDHRDAATPHTAGAREAVQEHGLFREVGPQKVGRGNVHEVPVVHAVEMTQVEPVEPSAFGLVLRPPEAVHEDDEGEQTLLVDPGGEQASQRRVVGVAEDARQPPHDGHRETNEDIALTVLAGTGLEEPARSPRPFGIGVVEDDSMHGRVAGHFGALRGSLLRSWFATVPDDHAKWK